MTVMTIHQPLISLIARGLILIMPRLWRIDESALGEEAWGGSSIVIPKEIAPDRFINILTGEEISDGLCEK